MVEKTHYKEIVEYVAAFGLGLILLLNLISIFGMANLGSSYMLPYVAVIIYVMTIVLNLRYYNRNKDKLDKLSTELKNKFRPNMTLGELTGIIMLIESVAIVLIMAAIR